MATFNFSYRSKKDVAHLQVRLDYYEDEKRKAIYAPSSIIVSHDFWVEYQKGINFKDAEKRNKKTDLDAAVNGLKEFLADEFKVNGKLEKKWLAGKIYEFENPKIVRDVPTELKEFIQYYLENRRFELSKGNLKKWGVVQHQMNRFIDSLDYYPEIKDVDENFKKNWVVWAANDGYAMATIKRTFKNLKTIIRYARIKGIETSIEFDTLRITNRGIELPTVYLSFSELDKIAAIENLPKELEDVRDWMLISCYTGQRVSDFSRFDTSMIREAKGKKYLDFKQVKTQKRVTVPILPEVENVLNKRGGNFPSFTFEQDYNRKVKEVAQTAGINILMKGKTIQSENGEKRGVIGVYEKWQLVTSHIGRRSFATNYYGKVPSAYIRKITGHSSEKMLLQYIGKTSTDTAAEAFDLFIEATK